MTVTAQLLSATPLRLLYLLSRDTGVGATLTIPNALGVTPDLRTDALLGATEGPMSGAGGSPMLAIMRARLDGYPPIAAGALTQAQARALLQSQDNARAVLISRYINRAVCRITARGATAAADNAGYWAVDANVDGDGDPVLDIIGPPAGATTQVAYLDIFIRHGEARL